MGSQVEKLNGEIRALGKEKIGILTKIKDFNKQINYMHWEHEYMETYIANLEEHYTDLHMLRVTKDLQVFIKGGDNMDRQKIALEKAEAKFEHMKKAHAVKLSKLQNQLSKVSRLIDAKVNENARLAAHEEELASSVAVRSSIQRARSD